MIMLDTLVDNYLSKAKGLPFFYAVDDVEYLSVLNSLKQAGLEEIRLSEFCKVADKYPNLDELIDSFRIADVDFSSNKCVITGLGEYLALKGEQEAIKFLRKLKNTTLGVARVVILLRYMDRPLKTIVEEDIRLKEQRVFFQSQSNNYNSIVNIQTDSNLGLVKETGIKFLLKQFESGATGKLYVKTDLDLSNSLIPITTISNSYMAVKQLVKGFLLPQSIGTEEQWGKLLSDVQKFGTLEAALDFYGLGDQVEEEFLERAIGYEYKNWIYFVSLKLNVEKIHNLYLRYVISSVDDFKSLKEHALNDIIKIRHNDLSFQEMYMARKKLLKGISESDIAIFVRENEIDTQESIYHFTDLTLMERHAIIKWVSSYGTVPELEYIYPALASYLKKYIFDCGKISQFLTDYFNSYKKQKIRNVLDENFVASVSEASMKYASLDTRANALSKIEDKRNCYLYWIDALGVEYLSYIQDLAREKGLSIKIDVVRADLPTITEINRKFYDEWNGGKKAKQSRLDEIKHKEKGGFDYEKCQAPIHLADELAVIEEAINTAYTSLALHDCKKFIIASDHGASRLAVIAHIEEKYETDTRGEHSGRCCKYFDDYDISYSVSEKGYIVLTNYGRFQKSRRANVEVHGGASLEETVIPVITLSLKGQITSDIRVLDAENIVIERKKGVTFKLYISDVENQDKVRVVLKERSYSAKCIDKTHYEICAPEIKRSGKYNVDIFDGENLLGSVVINVKGTVGTSNSDFDDLF